MEVLNIMEDLDDHNNDDIEVFDVINGLPRQVYVRNNYFDSYDNVNFRRRFRISKQCCLNLLVIIEERLEYPSDM
jgi:hypothetical protein